MERLCNRAVMKPPAISWTIAWTGALAMIMAGLVAQPACVQPEWTCGPATGVVKNVVDGDTIDLVSGERVRYLLVDTPELRGERGPDCFAVEATRINRDLVLGREIELHYDRVCHDRFGRLLAYVTLGGVDINRRLVERGYGCVLYIPPNGRTRRDQFSDLQDQARAGRRAMWGICPEVPCK